MIGVGSKVRLKCNILKSRIAYYSFFEILPNHLYTVVQVNLKLNSFQYKLDSGYWADVEDIVECSFEINLEKVLE